MSKTAAPSLYSLDNTQLARFVALRADAVRHTLLASEQAFPEVYERFGQRGRDACAEDIGFHLDFVRPVLETGEIAPFLAYLAWLAQVLGSRGIPHASVARSLTDLAAFFSDQLGPDGQPLAEALHAGAAVLTSGQAAPTYDSPCPERWPEVAAYGDAAANGQRRQAGQLFEQALSREASYLDAAVHVMQPAMYDIGRQWQQNQISVAQEHMATALSQTLMAQFAGRANAEPDKGLRVLLACSAGNHHTMGLRMVADAFELGGWTADFLGANLPPDALFKQIRASRPDVVAFSVSLPQQLQGLRQSVSTLRDTLGADCPLLLVGGLVFKQFPRLAEAVGADVVGHDATGVLHEVEQRLLHPV